MTDADWLAQRKSQVKALCETAEDGMMARVGTDKVTGSDFKNLYEILRLLPDIAAAMGQTAEEREVHLKVTLVRPDAASQS